MSDDDTRPRTHANINCMAIADRLVYHMVDAGLIDHVDCWEHDDWRSVAGKLRDEIMAELARGAGPNADIVMTEEID